MVQARACLHESLQYADSCSRKVRSRHLLTTVNYAYNRQQDEDIVYANAKAWKIRTMSAHRILGVEKLPRVWLFANESGT
jgi:hypothetical protein